MAMSTVTMTRKGLDRAFIRGESPAMVAAFTRALAVKQAPRQVSK